MDIKELQVSNGNDSKQNHPWEYARSTVVLSILKKFLKKRTRGNALDIGCGDVFFLTRFADKYPCFELIAVDTAFNQELISEIQSKNSQYCIKFLNNLHDVNGIQEADIIFLLDVLEHIEDDVRFLEDLFSQSYINPNTIIVITVPAFNYLYCNHDKWLGHYRRYSHTLLKQHIEIAGFSYIEGGYFFTSLLIPRFVQKIIEKFKKSPTITNQGIGNYKGGAILSFLYEKILLLDFYFFRLFRFLGIKTIGLSSYVICGKPFK
jgi:hypothetical protein